MNELIKIKNNEIIISNEFVKEYKEFQKIKLAMDLKEKEFKEELKNAMELVGKENLLLDGFSATIRKGSIQKRIDSKRLKEEMPDIFEEYSKEVETSSSLILKVE